jgi:hypothetical protein
VSRPNDDRAGEGAKGKKLRKLRKPERANGDLESTREERLYPVKGEELWLFSE